MSGEDRITTQGDTRVTTQGDTRVVTGLGSVAATFSDSLTLSDVFTAALGGALSDTLTAVDRFRAFIVRPATGGTQRGFRGLDPVPKDSQDPRKAIDHLVKYLETQNRVVGNNMLRGKLNATLDVTLARAAGTTTLTNPIFGGNSYIGWMPQTANAAAMSASIWVSAQDQETATLTHATVTASDLEFRLLIIG